MIDSDEAPPRSDPMLTKVQDLEEIAAKLLETARKIPPGPVRHDSLKEIGRLRVLVQTCVPSANVCSVQSDVGTVFFRGLA
jgi:hypothetical protein